MPPLFLSFSNESSEILSTFSKISNNMLFMIYCNDKMIIIILKPEILPDGKTINADYICKHGTW